MTSRPDLQPLPRRIRIPVSAGYVWRRFMVSVFGIWGVLTVIFIAVNLNGSPVTAFVDPELATAEEIAAVTRELGYDRPIWVRYGIFLRDLLGGDFPKSYRYGESSLTLVLDRLPVTALLAVSGLAVGLIVGLVAGYVSGTGRGVLARQGPLLAMNTIRAIPDVVIGILLMFAFGVALRWLPVMGLNSWRGLVLPALVLGLSIAPSLARTYRASIISNLDSDHVRTALAKGIAPIRVRLRHVGMNALVPVVSLFGLQTANLLGGAILVENMFGIPGLGQLGASALNNRDYPVIIAVVFLSAAIFIAVNFIVDVAAAILDPRIRIE